MKRTIAIVNQKGGVGKTTTAVNLSASLAENNKKVLLIDFDPQGNSTSGFGIDKHSLENTIYDLLIGESSFDDTVIIGIKDNLHIIPSNINLAGAEVELLAYENREFVFKTIFDKYKSVYDFIIIDCPPSLNILTLNALCGTDSILVPLQCEFYAMEGLTQLIQTIELVKKNLNPKLIIEGIVFTMYDARTNLSNQVLEEVISFIDKSIYVEIIPRNVRLSEAPSHGLPITDYDPKSKGAEAYQNLAKLVIGR